MHTERPMVSKILFVVLISCTAILASPINRNDANAESSEELPAFFESLKNIFGKLLGKFLSVIVESLTKVFDKIQQRLDSKEFRLAVKELEQIVAVIFNENEELKGDSETKEIIRKQLDKVGDAFRNMFEEAIEYMEEGSDKTADASEFKNAVDELKYLVDKLYH